MKACRYCSSSFEPSAWQIAKSDFACVPCNRIKQAEWRARRKSEGRAVVSTRMPREYHQAYDAVYLQDAENRERRNKLMRGYAKAHKTADHHKARRKVRTAIESGRMHRSPCEVCGATKTHAHHDDYSKPLDVRWLCPAHHREHHAKATGETL